MNALPKGRSAPPNDTIVAQAVLEGISRANKAYKSWSGGFWLSDAGIENIVQTYVAEACFNALKGKKLQVHPEASRSYFFDSPDKHSPRFDIAITDGQQFPVYVIELKRSPKDKKGISRDIQKLLSVLLPSDSASPKQFRAAYWGCFVSWRYSHACRSLSDCIEAAKKTVDGLIPQPALDVVWHERNLGKVFWPDKDQNKVEWRAAALVAVITPGN